MARIRASRSIQMAKRSHGFSSGTLHIAGLVRQPGLAAKGV
jgi:hypothetical protein